MKDSTRKLVTRIKLLIKEAGENSRLNKVYYRTPFEQRPPYTAMHQVNWAARANLLCAVRADMRGRLHRAAWAGEGLQRAAILKDLADRVKVEAAVQGWKKDPTFQDPTFPKWLRTTIETALVAGDKERERFKQREARYAAHKYSKPVLTEAHSAA